MADELKIIQQDEYPEPRLFDCDVNLYAEVSVPTVFSIFLELTPKKNLH